MEKVKPHEYINANEKRHKDFLGKCIYFYNVMPFSEVSTS
jgi:hypothetical protein